MKKMQPTKNNIFLEEKKEGFSTTPEYFVTQAGPDTWLKEGQKVILSEPPIKSGEYIITNDELVVGFE